MKRIFDISLSLFGLIILSPLIIFFCFLIWVQDFKNPFYVAERVGRDEKIFLMIKFRTMIVNASKTGVDSTAIDDVRITRVGQIIRKFKIDEIPQLINVLIGDMSLVGPRPNVIRETNLYSKEEKKILSIRPGITDISSIVFSDEGEVLKGSEDPDILYNQVIRPWKSRLALFYITYSNLVLDIRIILWTLISILQRDKVLKIISNFLNNRKCDSKLVEVCKRDKKLTPYPPPGFNEIIKTRD